MTTKCRVWPSTGSWPAVSGLLLSFVDRVTWVDNYHSFHDSRVEPLTNILNSFIIDKRHTWVFGGKTWEMLDLPGCVWTEEITRWVPTWLTALSGWEGSLSEAQWSEEDSCCKDQHRLWPQWVGVCVWLCECEWSLPGVGLEMLCGVVSCPGEQGGPGLVQLWHRQAEAREYANTMFNKLACACLMCSLPLLFIHLFFATNLVGS